MQPKVPLQSRAARTRTGGMKAILTLCTLSLLLSTLKANTGFAFYGDAPDATHPWAVHDWNRPQPPRVEPRPTTPKKPSRPPMPSCCSTAPRPATSGKPTSPAGEPDQVDRQGRRVPMRAEVRLCPHQGKIRRLPGARRMGRAHAAAGREPGPRQQRHLPRRPRRNSGARQLRQSDLCRRLRLLHVWRQSAARQRAAPARRMAVDRHRLPPPDL